MSISEKIAKASDMVNTATRRQLLYADTKSPILKANYLDRKYETYKKGGKAMKKVASIPIEVDRFFTKIYGEHYYKDPKFFDRYPEWKVI